MDELRYRARTLKTLMRSCSLCPRDCGVDRLNGSVGFCSLGPELRVARVLIHQGEEPPLVGHGGSGAVFLSGCTMRCLFCQNYQISHEGAGKAMTARALADELLDLQSSGCVNVNLVTPTAQLPAILEAIAEAREKDLRLPLIYNTGGYESVEVLRHLEGVVDVYLPDFKYGTNEAAERFSQAPQYVEHCLEAIREMYRQAGGLKVEDGLAVGGLIVRHLVLPGNLARTERVLELLAREVSPDVSLSLMAQYRPCFRASEEPEVDRRLEPGEYQEAVSLAECLGFTHGWYQDLEEIDGGFLPDFEKDQPFS